MKISFLIIAISILLTINSFVIIRGWQALSTVSTIRPYYLATMILFFIALLSSLIFGHLMPHNIAKVVSFFGFTYMIVFIYLLLSFLIVDIVRIANYFIHFLPVGMANFRLWTMLGTLAITSIALVIGNYKFNHPKIVTLNLTTNKPKQYRELKIVAISDLHLGISIDKGRLKNFVKLINDQHPDIVLMAGDVSDRSIIPIVRQNLNEELRLIKAPLGVYAINGNHEHYAETPNATAEYLKSAGIRVLRDEVSMINSRFYVIGRNDRSNLNRKNLSEIVKRLDKDLPKILMDHQPFHLEEAEKLDIDLQISGHTHNGQFFPGNLVVKKMYELGYGYLKKGNTNYYVSSGLGLWGPQYRIGSDSELVVINLKY